MDDAERESAERRRQSAEVILAAMRGETATVILQWEDIDDSTDGVSMARELGLI